MTPDEQREAELRGFNLPVQHRLWRDVLLPRSILPLFWLAWIVLLPAWLLGIPARRRRRGVSGLVALESGRVGWTQVFFEELWQSLREYAGDDRVVQHVIDRDLPYLRQFRELIRLNNPSHVVLDMRTPGQSWRRSLIEAIGVSWLMLRTGRTAVVILPDAFYRRLRWQAACLTAFEGVVLTFASSDILAPVFPHRRIVGPLPMPVSRQRLAWLEQIREPDAVGGSQVQFIGHYYPPRSDLLEAVADRLAGKGISLSINGDKWGTSNEDYWRTLATSTVVITTCMQGPDRPFGDWMWTQQLVFRYNETLAAGSALVAARVQGSERFFTPGVDFLEFVSLDEAVSAIESLLFDPVLRERIAKQGHATSRALSETNAFWSIADSVLLKHPIVVRG